MDAPIMSMQVGDCAEASIATWLLAFEGTLVTCP